jgi:hypothetical protein
MSLLRRTRGELAGAWRSLRYDLGRRPAEPPADGPDMTSTGMNTFGGHLMVEEPPTGYGQHGRPPRRALAVSLLGLLTVLGAAGAYLGVVNGLGSIAPERPAAADTFPIRPAVSANAEIGAGPARRAGRPATAGTVAATPPAAQVEAAAVLPPFPQPPATTSPVSPVRTTKPTSTECRCNPPVPTPTAPTSSPSPTPSADPSDPWETPAPGEPSATPDESAEPSESPRHRRWRRHH